MKVLIVDDQPMVLRIVSRKLSKERFDIMNASSVEEALPMYHLCPPDMIITNLNLPGKGGLELIKHVRADEEKRIPIIVLSGTHIQAEILDAFQFGANDFIAKPFQHEELIWRTKRFFA